ncbi:hypothetical protein HCY90_00845 [Limosilactobacillus fermentum]
MTDKELFEVSNRAWDAFVDQLPEKITGRDLLKIIIRFVVNIANAVDIKPTTVCMMMYDRLNNERHFVKAINSIENVLSFAGIVALIIGESCALWFDYKLGTKILVVGCICILTCWTLEFAAKVIDRWL